MAGLGFKDFANGNVLTGDELDGYLMQQSVMRFASITERDNALAAVVADGMVTSVNGWLQVRQNGAWRDITSAEQFIRKLSDTARPNNVTATADPELTFTAEANTNYRVRAVLFATVDGANSTVDMKVGLSFPSGTLATFGCEGPDTAIANGSGVAASNWYAYLDVSASSVFAVGVSNNATLATKIIVEGTVRVGATAGPVAVIWAQFATSANALHVRPNSYLEVRKLAA